MWARVVNHGGMLLEDGQIIADTEGYLENRGTVEMVGPRTNVRRRDSAAAAVRDGGDAAARLGRTEPRNGSARGGGSWSSATTTALYNGRRRWGCSRRLFLKRDRAVRGSRAPRRTCRAAARPVSVDTTEDHYFVLSAA